MALKKELKLKCYSEAVEIVKSVGHDKTAWDTQLEVIYNTLKKLKEDAQKDDK